MHERVLLVRDPDEAVRGRGRIGQRGSDLEMREEASGPRVDPDHRVRRDHPEAAVDAVGPSRRSSDDGDALGFEGRRLDRRDPLGVSSIPDPDATAAGREPGWICADVHSTPQVTGGRVEARDRPRRVARHP